MFLNEGMYVQNRWKWIVILLIKCYNTIIIKNKMTNKNKMIFKVACYAIEIIKISHVIPLRFKLQIISYTFSVVNFVACSKTK
jgi:hypothetical protein